MNGLIAIFTGLALAIGLACLVVLILRGSLYALLVELCGSESRARFWQAYTTVAMLVGTLAAALVGMPGGVPRGPDGAARALDALEIFRAGTVGLLLALGFVAFTLVHSITREVDARRAAQFSSAARERQAEAG